MKPFITTAIAVITALSITSGSALSGEAEYSCQGNILGLGCLTRYIGPVDENAAKLYFEEASSAVERIIKGSKKVATASYRPATGTLVLIAREGRRPDNYELRDIAAHFGEKHLYLEAIVVKTASGGFIISSKDVKNNHGGRSRMFSLRNVKFDPGMPINGANAPGFAEGGVVEYDVLGNSVVTF